MTLQDKKVGGSVGRLWLQAERSVVVRSMCRVLEGLYRSFLSPGFGCQYSTARCPVPSEAWSEGKAVGMMEERMMGRVQDDDKYIRGAYDGSGEWRRRGLYLTEAY